MKNQVLTIAEIPKNERFFQKNVNNVINKHETTQLIEKYN